MQMTRYLKLVLTADGLSCLGMGAGLIAAAAPLSNLFGLSEGLLLGAGMALLPVGLFILAVAVRSNAVLPFVHVIVAGNALWVAASAALAVNAAGITVIGTAFVLAQAAAVAMLTLLEAIGATRASRALATVA